MSELSDVLALVARKKELENLLRVCAGLSVEVGNLASRSMETEALDEWTRFHFYMAVGALAGAQGRIERALRD